MSLSFFFFNDTATTEIYTLSLHDALPICEIEQILDTLEHVSGRETYSAQMAGMAVTLGFYAGLRPSETAGLRWENIDLNKNRRSEEHTSELQSQSNLVCRLLLEKKKSKRWQSPFFRRHSICWNGQPLRQRHLGVGRCRRQRHPRSLRREQSHRRHPRSRSGRHLYAPRRIGYPALPSGSPGRRLFL